MIFRKILLYLLFINLMAYSSVNWGQTGKIKGTVIDIETGERLPLVNVMIVGNSLGAAADLNGIYSIINILPGIYSLKASAIGYNSQTYQNVNVSMDLTTEIDFELTSKSVELDQDVIVVAKRDIVIKDLTSSTAIINSNDLMALPVTEIQEVLQLQAGVVGESVRGGRSGEVLYTIDGVSVSDVYDNSAVVMVNTGAVQELQFVSGAFNAEFGKALSGVVNLATKEGDNDFTGSVTLYLGDNVSNHSNIFRGIDDFKPLSINNVDVSFSGPIIKDFLYFFTNARHVYKDGYYYGKRIYNPWDITKVVNTDAIGAERYDIQQTGDDELVPMNFIESLNLHGRLTFLPYPRLKLNVTSIFNKDRFKTYDHNYSYNPDGDLNRFQSGLTNILSLTHTLSSRTFYRFNISHYYKNYKHYVYEDPNDLRYTHSKLLTQAPTESPSFFTGGTKNERFDRKTSSLGYKFDITSQINDYNQIKAGIEYNINKFALKELYLLQWLDKNGNGIYDPNEEGVEDPQLSGNPFILTKIPNSNDPNENLAITDFNNSPTEFSTYIQDKIEFSDLIINIGVRLDYFSPDGKILSDPTDPDIYRPRRQENINKTLEERKVSWYKNATDKYQISPRIGFAFPITATGVVHFSYGHFYQTPQYSLLYTNPDYKFGYSTGNLGIAGNPDLKPEETISGEIGLQQAIFENVVFDITAYFRDIRNLTGTRADEIYLYGGAGKYSQYVNSDFGFVKGLVVTLDKRFEDNWSAKIDYTLQFAKGNASDPNETRNQLASGQQPEVQLLSLDWDQTHTLNMSLNYSSPLRWGASIIFQYGSGFPYTPTQSTTLSKLLNNSEKKPYTLNADVRFYYDFNLSDNLRLSLFARIYNIFDIKNQLNVYNDSGTADFTIDEYYRNRDDNPDIINSVDEYYRNPNYYSEPRRVELGLSIYF
jgi:outer membrane receptor for ferrienterochelin and colicin